MAATKILIVDDDLTIRNIYAEIFKRNNFEVLEAFDGLEGLDVATKELPDIIFTGIIMPRMDGFALKEALGKNVATAAIPVIMNSHMGRQEDRKKAMEMGIREFFVQGMVTPKEVVERVKVMFGNSVKGYKLKFMPSELDAPELAKDLDYGDQFLCRDCGSPMVMELQVRDNTLSEFSARIVCPNCPQ